MNDNKKPRKKTLKVKKIPELGMWEIEGDCNGYNEYYIKSLQFYSAKEARDQIGYMRQREQSIESADRAREHYSNYLKANKK